ncbi:MAG: SGNH/GDSL hydrolase family protein, partial [Chloroflexota bacterium]
PLPCELHQTLPAVMFVSIGANDARNGTDAFTFQSILSQLVNTIAANGTIPVLLTIPDDGSTPNTAVINETIIIVAQANDVPLLNVARALAQRPDASLNASPTGAGDLSSTAISNYGINAVNFGLLRVLGDARNIVFPDA